MIVWMLGGGFVLMAAGFLMGYVWCDWRHAERAAAESRNRRRTRRGHELE